MSCSSGANKITSGLVFELDASNYKSNFRASPINLETNPEDLTSWVSPSGGNTNITINATIAPDGTTTADKIYETTSTNAGSIHIFAHTGFLVTGTQYRLSFFVKAAERYIIGAGSNNGLGSCVINLNTQTVLSGSATIIPYPNGWYRISTLLTPGGGAGIYMGICDNTGTNVYTGDGTSGFYVWGIQAELGTALTPYYSSSGWYDLIMGSSGTLTNGPTYSSTNSGIFTFDGVNDYVALPAIVTSTLNGSTWSYSGIIMTTNSSIGGAFLGPKNLSKGRCCISVVWSSAGQISFANEMIASFGPAISIANNEYMFICFTYDGTQLRAYKNGILIGSPTTYAFTGDCAGPYSLSGPGPSYVWNGSIGNFSLYNRALSAAEVSQNFNAVRGRYGI